MTTRTWLLACAGCAVMGLAVGRASSPPPDTIATETARENQEATERVEATATVVTQVDERASEERVVVRERVVYREGPVQERTREVDYSSAEAAAVAHQRAEEIRVEVREVEVERLVERRVEVQTPLPDWRVGAMVGVDLGGPSVAYGAQIERRILGPIYVGAWGLSNGAGGVAIGIPF